MSINGKMSRRDVLLGGLAASSFSLLGPLANGRAASLSSRDKMNVAFVGIGGYGVRAVQKLESQNIVALCDVDWRTTMPGPFGRRFVTAASVAASHPKARRFNDWRVMLDKMGKQIDGICVSTADHTHAGAVLTAMQMGKHVLCEKPLAHNIDEVRAMMAAERKYPHLATQTGVQGHVSEDRRRVTQWIREGRLGKIEEVHLYVQGFHPPPNARSRFHFPPPYSQIKRIHEKIPVPSEVKWDLWLGPAPYRPYNPMYLPAMWRVWVPFGTGILGDHGPHFLDPVYSALDLGFPDTIQAETDAGYNPATNGTEMWPVQSKIHYHFPARGKRPAVPLTWYGYETPPTPKGWKSGRPLPGGGGIIVGSRGTLVFGQMYMGLPTKTVPGMVTLVPDELDKEYHNEKPPAPSLDLWMEWAERAKAGKQGSADFQFGGMLTQICLLGDIALRHRGELLKFDSGTEKFTNSESANSMFTRTYRPGWALPS